MVLPYPAALGGIQSSMAWQAVVGMPFSMVGGGGPGVTRPAGSERPGFDVLARASVPLGPTQLHDGQCRAIRQALRGWRVTTIVVPDQPSIPTYDQGRTVAYAVGLFTAALGGTPTYQAQRLGVERRPPQVVPTDVGRLRRVHRPGGLAGTGRGGRRVRVRTG